MIRYLGFRSLVRILKPSQHASSSLPLTAAAVNNNVSSATNDDAKLESDSNKSDSEIGLPKRSESKVKSKLVSSVFDSLKKEEIAFSSSQDGKSSMLLNSKDVNSLLANVKPTTTRQDALKIVSVLADWTTAGRIATSDFENDKRFRILCKILGNYGTIPATKPHPIADDLATVLGVAGDDEAAKIIANISVHHMVRVMVSLSLKKRRSLPVLRSLAFNIGKSSEKLNIKQSADVLYASAQLNFYDEVLLEKICSDLCECVMDNTKRAVVGSILTSLGLLKYKNTELLDLLSQWTVDNLNTCHSNDLVALLLTLATVNYVPQQSDNLFQKIMENVSQEDLPSANVWLDVVWSLVILGQATHEQVASVLSEEFFEKLAIVYTEEVSLGTKLKLLNINGAAKLKLKDYSGPLLDLTNEQWKITIQRTKEKQVMVTSVLDTLSNLVPSSIYVLTNINSGMGFYIDGECVVDSNLNPLPLIDKKTGQLIERSSSRGVKVAILALDYHDMTRGLIEPTGLACFARDLLKCQGYRVLTVQYSEFNPRDKLVSRVKYLKDLLTTTVQQS